MREQTERGQRWGELLVVPVGAFVLTGSTLLLVWLLTPAGSYLRQFFFERSWIQYASTGCFWAAMMILAQRHLWFRQEHAAYKSAQSILAGPEFASTLIWSDAERMRHAFAVDRDARSAKSLTFSRIVNALDRLRKTQSTNAMQEYCHTRSEVDGSELETSYADVRFLTWMIPTLGFIGTVMGIGWAISGFSGVIAQAEDFSAVREYLPTVTLYLGTAFDTTLLALGLSAIVLLYMSMLLKRQEALLSRIDTLCFDGLCAAFQEHSTSSLEVVRAISDAADKVRDRMNGNRAALEQVIRSQMPIILADTLGARLTAGTGAIGPETVQKVGDLLTEVRGLRADLGRAESHLARIAGNVQRMEGGAEPHPRSPRSPGREPDPREGDGGAR